MIPGFKTGPQNFAEGQAIVTNLGASMCEVWFNVIKQKEYKEMLGWLTKHNVAIGLHHWGVVDANIKTNLATHDNHIREETIRQIKQTIDIGAGIGCVYVNAHPGAESIETIDFATGEQTMKDTLRTPKAVAETLFLEAAQELHSYAESRNVLLTIESIPARETVQGSKRINTYDAGNMSLSALEQYTQHGGWFANDISHTGSHILLSESSPDTAWQKLLEFSKRVAERTRLVHMNVITPPYNGTDSHDGITEEDFKQETFPDKEGLQAFLMLFKNRDDVFVVNEPKKNHMGNYEALQALVTSL